MLELTRCAIEVRVAACWRWRYAAVSNGLGQSEGRLAQAKGAKAAPQLTCDLRRLREHPARRAGTDRRAHAQKRIMRISGYSWPIPSDMPDTLGQARLVYLTCEPKHVLRVSQRPFVSTFEVQCDREIVLLRQCEQPTRCEQ